MVSPFKWQEFWKFISCVLSSVTFGKKLHKLLLPVAYGKKDTSFGVKYRNILVRRRLLNYEEIFLGKLI